MKSLPDLHDGFFDGVCVSANKGTRLFVRTEAGEGSTIVLSDVEALNITDIRGGNIIFDLVLIAPDKLTVKHMEQAYASQSGAGERSRRLLSNAQEQRLSVLEINSSYGAECTVFFRAANIVPEHVLG